MCETCGCLGPELSGAKKGKTAADGNDERHGHSHHAHGHDHGDGHAHTHNHDYDSLADSIGRNRHGHDHAGEQRRIEIGKSVLEKNDAFAVRNRALFKARGLFVVNLISSPGSGKTALLEMLAGHFGQAMGVIEGDVQTRRDADRVIRAGSRAYQIETAGACHLDANSIGHALDHETFEGCRILVIENVGNLVCPAAYDLGEHEKWAILSLPEGDDKVLKYPALFTRIQALIINKIDLADRLDFSVRNAVNECKSLNNHFVSFEVSAKTGKGVEGMIRYLKEKTGIKIT